MMAGFVVEQKLRQAARRDFRFFAHGPGSAPEHLNERPIFVADLGISL